MKQEARDFSHVRFTKNTRSNDIVMRLGGDEFAAFFVGNHNEENAKSIFDRVFKDISAINFPPLEDTVSVSIGACFCAGKKNFDEVYKEADTCVYLSKKQQGNSFTISSMSNE